MSVDLWVHVCVGVRRESACVSVVSCPDPTLSWGKGSGDHWVVSWLCWVSSLDTEPNEIVLRHTTMCSTRRPVCSLMPRSHPRLCCTTQVTWLMAFCWLGTTKKLLDGHQTPFLVRGWDLGTRLVWMWMWVHVLVWVCMWVYMCELHVWMCMCECICVKVCMCNVAYTEHQLHAGLLAWLPAFSTWTGWLSGDSQFPLSTKHSWAPTVLTSK